MFSLVVTRTIKLAFELISPEILLLFLVLGCLLYIATFDLQIQNNNAVVKRRIAWTIQDITEITYVTAIYGYILALFIMTAQYKVGDLFNIEVWTYAYDFSYIFEHSLKVFDLYSTAFKFLIISTTYVIITKAAPYITFIEKPIMEFFIIMTLAVFFLCILVSAQDFMVAFTAIIGFSLNTYVLILSEAAKHNSREAAIKYYYLSAFSSGLIIFGIWLLYFTFVTTNFIDTAWNLYIWNFAKHIDLCACTVVFLVFGFLFKLSAFPCHLWVAAVYEGSPLPVLTFFILPIKIAVLGFVFKLFFWTFAEWHFIWSSIFWLASIGSMIFGALAALVEKKIKKFLAYSSINQMGFLLIGLIGCSPESLSASIIYLFIYIINNIAILSVLLTAFETNSERQMVYLTDFTYLAKDYAFGLITALFSMAGIPPLAGFFGKYFLLISIFDQKYYSLVVVAILTSMISTYYYLKIIKFFIFDEHKNKKLNFNIFADGYWFKPVFERDLPAVILIFSFLFASDLYAIMSENVICSGALEWDVVFENWSDCYHMLELNESH